MRLPPPIIFLAGFLLGVAIERYVTPLPLSRPLAPTALGWALVASGYAFTLWGMRTFVRARTAIYPTQPASALVQNGPYRFTRNPMYLGLTVMYLGGSILIASLWPFVLLPGVLAVVFYAVIRREERYLTTAFGDAYRDYTRRVRRWL